MLLSEVLRAHPEEVPQPGFHVRWEGRSLRVAAVLERTCVVDDPSATPTPKRLLRLDSVEVEPETITWIPISVKARGKEEEKIPAMTTQLAPSKEEEKIPAMAAQVVSPTGKVLNCERCGRFFRARDGQRRCTYCRSICDCGHPKDPQSAMCVECRKAVRKRQPRPLPSASSQSVTGPTPAVAQVETMPSIPDLVRETVELRQRVAELEASLRAMVTEERDRLVAQLRQLADRIQSWS